MNLNSILRSFNIAILCITINTSQTILAGKHFDLIFAAAGHNKEEVLKLASQGININSPDRFGWTSLHTACSNGNQKMVETLLACGAHVNCITDDGFTPLYFASCHGAAQKGYPDIVKILFKYGAIINIKTKYKLTAFDAAELKNNTEIVSLFVIEVEKRERELENLKPIKNRLIQMIATHFNNNLEPILLLQRK